MDYSVMGVRRLPGAMLLAAAMLCSGRLAAQTPADPPTSTAPQAPAAQEGQPIFRGGIDLVTIRAVVRDGKGRPVTGLTAREFLLVDNGVVRRPNAVEHDNGPIGVALMFDISGSMDIDERFSRARETSYFLLSGLRTGEDEAAIFAFDSGLHVVQPFTTELDKLRGSLSSFSPWGMIFTKRLVPGHSQSTQRIKSAKGAPHTSLGRRPRSRSQ